MASKSSYVLTEKVKVRLEGQGYVFECERCEEPISVGDELVSKYSMRSARKVYHKECWNKMFM